MSNVDLLKRMDLPGIKLDPEQDMPDSRQTLASPAATELATRIALKGRPLLKDLQVLGITPPFTPGSVKAYKAQMLKEAKNGETIFDVPLLAFIGLTLLVALVDVFSLYHYNQWIHPNHLWLLVTYPLTIASFVLVIITAKVVPLEGISGRRVYARWAVDSIGQAPFDLPDSAVLLASSITEAQPNAVFLVERLDINIIKSPLFDALLVVVLDNEMYHIAVWDEPGFDAKLLA